MTPSNPASHGPGDCRARVLFVGPLPPPIGGMSAYAAGYLVSPIAAAFEVTHLHPDRLGKRRWAGWRRRLVNVANAAALTWRLLWVLLARRPKLAHILTSSYGGFFEKSFLALLCRATGCRVLMHVHGGGFGDFYTESSAFVRWLVRACLRLNHRVAVLSQEMYGVFLSIGLKPQRLAVLGNAVAVPERSIWDRPKGAESSAAGQASALTVLFLNRIDRAKGVLELVMAAGHVCVRFPEIRFRIVGPESDLSAELRERITAAGLAGQVEVAPAVEGESKAAAYLNADVYVLPSHVEAMPGGLLEAMSYGLPCVATPVGAVASIMAGGQHGLLVPVDDSDALAEAIEKLAGDVELRRRLGTAARTAIIGRFDWDTRAAEIAQVYEELLGERSFSAGV